MPYARATQLTELMRSRERQPWRSEIGILPITRARWALLRAPSAPQGLHVTGYGNVEFVSQRGAKRRSTPTI
jgi:hypothetical protein